ncbi:MAG: phage tail tape measure protein, partial [Rhizobiales bacterium]|nr:phage tail tape measure protein [Hyphomicrobiales bacterium]
MAKIATLNIDLTASSAKFRDEMKRAEKITRKWRRQVSRDLRAAGVAFAGLGAAAAAGLTGLTRASLQNIDTLAKTSDKLGTTTEGLAGLRFA